MFPLKYFEKPVFTDIFVHEFVLPTFRKVSITHLEIDKALKQGSRGKVPCAENTIVEKFCPFPTKFLAGYTTVFNIQKPTVPILATCKINKKIRKIQFGCLFLLLKHSVEIKNCKNIIVRKLRGQRAKKYDERFLFLLN